MGVQSGWPRGERRLVEGWVSIPVLEKQMDCVSCKRSSGNTAPPARLLTGHDWGVPDRYLKCTQIFFSFLFWPHPIACKTLVPQPGIKPTPLALKARSCNYCTARKSHWYFSLKFHFPSQGQSSKLWLLAALGGSLSIDPNVRSWSGDRMTLVIRLPFLLPLFLPQ